MAQTKRKRRNTKHRGNAVGVVEARGRTSKPREGERRSSAAGARGGSGAARGARPLKPPTLQSSLIKAAIGGLVLFALARFGVLGKSATTGGALGLAAVAVAFYTPIMYLTDRMIYRRKTQPRKR